MNTISYHVFAPEHRDTQGRQWCAVCGLPRKNARAKRLHDTSMLRDWRAEAWDDTVDDEIERAEAA